MDGTPSPLEERIWKQMSRALGLRDGGTLADDPGRLDWFRSDLRNTAYHEAGHVAVDAFFWYTYGHIRYVSIMPKRQSAGNCLADRCPSLDSIQRLGREAATPHVWKRMMIALAGWCAVRVVGGHCIDRFTVPARLPAGFGLAHLTSFHACTSLRVHRGAVRLHRLPASSRPGRSRGLPSPLARRPASPRLGHRMAPRPRSPQRRPRRARPGPSPPCRSRAVPRPRPRGRPSPLQHRRERR